MRLVIEYDPWADTDAAKRAADALTTLGIPAELREVRATSQKPPYTGPVKFESAPSVGDDSHGDLWASGVADYVASVDGYVLVEDVLKHLRVTAGGRFEQVAHARVVGILKQLGYRAIRVRPPYSLHRVIGYTKSTAESGGSGATPAKKKGGKR